jgi:nucleotide-binding universal stress UspA family protein
MHVDPVVPRVNAPRNLERSRCSRVEQGLGPAGWFRLGRTGVGLWHGSVYPDCGQIGAGSGGQRSAVGRPGNSRIAGPRPGRSPALSARRAQGLADRGFACETATPYGESPAAWIVKEAHLRACDMIVMTTHGRTGPSRWWFGSVAEDVVAHSPVPVLLDRAWHPWQRTLLLEDGPRLLVPLDESPFDAAALHVAARLAEDLGGELILIHVDPRAADVMTADQAVADFTGEPDVLANDESAYLKDVAASLLCNWPGVSVRTRLAFGSPAEAIALAAAETNAGLVVMATHGRTGLPRAVVGSVAGRLLEFDTVPLVLVNPAAHDRLTGVAEHGVAHASRS